MIKAEIGHHTNARKNSIIFFLAWVWFQSGLNTDGAHNPVTSRRLQKGDILSMNCFPIIQG
jgi:hypothetical protein